MACLEIKGMYLPKTIHIYYAQISVTKSSTVSIEKGKRRKKKKHLLIASSNGITNSKM